MTLHSCSTYTIFSSPVPKVFGARIRETHAIYVPFRYYRSPTSILVSLSREQQNSAELLKSPSLAASRLNVHILSSYQSLKIVSSSKAACGQGLSRPQRVNIIARNPKV
jgi:hypothetical protein